MRFHYIRKPYRHQHKTVIFMLKHPEAACFSDPGTGKSKSGIDTSRFLMKFRDAKRVLIVSPFCVIWQWQREIRLNSHFKSAVVYGTRAKRLKILKQTKPKFFIINYDALIMEDVFKALFDKNFDVVVFDESIFIKNWKAKRTKMAFILARKATNIYILSGKPINNDVADIFGQYLVLDGGATFGNNFYRFRNRFWRKRGPYNWVLRKGALETIKGLMYQKAIAFNKDECLDLPPKIFQRKDIILTPDQVRVYREIDREGVTILRDHEKNQDINYVVKFHLARWQKKQQITSGFLYTSKDRKEWYDFKPNPKLEVLRELISTEFAGVPVAIVCRFRRDLDSVRSVLPSRSVEISGRTNAAKMAAKFQEEPDIQYAVVQIGAGGLGIDLYRASVMIFYSWDFRLDHFEQVQDRLHRLGQTADKCLYVLLVVKNYIDDHMMAAINHRKNIADYLLGIDVKEGRMKNVPYIPGGRHGEGEGDTP